MTSTALREYTNEELEAMFPLGIKEVPLDAVVAIHSAPDFWEAERRCAVIAGWDNTTSRERMSRKLNAAESQIFKQLNRIKQARWQEILHAQAKQPVYGPPCVTCGVALQVPDQ